MIPLHSIEDAFQFDATLKASKADLQALEKKYLHPVNYSKKALFDAMYEGYTIVFNDYPIHYPLPPGSNKITHTLNLLRNNLRKTENIYIRYGSSRTRKKVTISEVIDRWVNGRSKFGVTDLHFRDMAYFKKIDADAVSYFNLLPHFPEEVSFLEMLTLVISSRGIFSDSHSDDGDGSNHCIVGTKLWFAWDKSEGERVGLEDCTHHPVYDQAKFSIKKFLSLKSAHWFLVTEGKTLFMPGNFTHKVVTLEPYIGFGSFYLSLPNYINSVRRWVLLQSSDANAAFIESLSHAFLKYLRKDIPKMSAGQRTKMGFDYFLKAVKEWDKGLTKKEAATLREKAMIDTILSS
jgi:hypothetical protein